MGGMAVPHDVIITLLSLVLATQSQRAHFWAHARRHTPEELPQWVKTLQDWRVLLHPKEHAVHHETYNCNFCIINGWANPYVQMWYRGLVFVGVVDDKLGMKPDPHDLKIQQLEHLLQQRLNRLAERTETAK